MPRLLPSIQQQPQQPQQQQQQQQLQLQQQQARPQLYKRRQREGKPWKRVMTASQCQGLICVVVVLIVGMVLSLQLLLLSNTSQWNMTTKVTLTVESESIRIRTRDRHRDSSSASSVSSRARAGSTPSGNKNPSHQAAALRQQESQNHHPSNHTFQYLYDAESPMELLHNLPAWIRNYVTWHSQMRRQFPGMQLFEHPDAPPVLIRVCLGVCGGLHDRLGQLPWDLYLANATQRVLLIAWQRPRSLEHFLVPNDPTQLLDWTVPPNFHFGFDDMHRVRNVTGLFQGYPEDHPTDDFWNYNVDAALERAISGEFRHEKVLRHRILGHLGEDALQQRLNRVVGAGATDLVHTAPQFGRIFWVFFRPSDPVQQWMQTIVHDLQFQPQQYTAVHCRVRHPKATSYGNHILGKNPKYPADKTGLPWEGDTRQFALDVAKTALECSRRLNTHTGVPPKQEPPSSPHQQQQQPLPVYFLSDSNDLVRHVALELTNPEFVQANRSQLDMELLDLIEQQQQQQQVPSKPTTTTTSLIKPWIRARDVTEETAHLDRQKGRPVSAYYATFVDLMLVIHARCVVYGIGYYAAFGAKISGAPCQYLYQQEAWGNQAQKGAQVCPNTMDHDSG